MGFWLVASDYNTCKELGQVIIRNQMNFLNIVLASSLISISSLAGVIFITWQKDRLHRFLLLLVALSAGTLLGSVFLHLLPEALELLPVESVLGLTLTSFIGFVLLEKVLHWRHCHTDDCDEHPFGYMNLVGDGVHNFIDGLIIASAFLTSPMLGWTTTLAIALHEIPQEIGDLGVLLHAKFSRRKAIFFNLITAFLALIGAVTGYFLATQVQALATYLIPVAAGGFLYIGASDLIPELRQEKNKTLSLYAFIMFLVGIGLLLIWRH